MLDEYDVSQRFACRTVGLSRSVYRYQIDTGKDDVVISALNTLVSQYPAYGFAKLFVLIRRQGHVWNHKRVHRVYCELGLSKRRRTKERIPSRETISLQQPLSINQTWSIDFMSDSLDCGRRFPPSMSWMTLIVKY